jgi:patatin-like phospholipase/acyl hydrolase
MDKQNKPFKILAIDGGGIRGIYAAHILKRIQNEYKIDYRANFDIITGTSTGSILAAGIAVGHPIDKLCDFYERYGHEIFSIKPKSSKLNKIGAIFNALYDKRRLYSLLNDIFENMTLGDVKTALLIPVTNASNGNTMVIKSSYKENLNFTRDATMKLSEAVLASCSAPIYFSPTLVKEYLLADGGLWANNPALVGLTEALSFRLNIGITDVKVLSIGTGQGKIYYNPADHNKKWGFLQWGGPDLISTILNVQSISVHNMLKLILNKQQYLRLNHEFEGDPQLDNVNIIKSLLSQADQVFTENSDSIKHFLYGGG